MSSCILMIECLFSIHRFSVSEILKLLKHPSPASVAQMLSTMAPHQRSPSPSPGDLPNLVPPGQNRYTCRALSPAI